MANRYTIKRSRVDPRRAELCDEEVGACFSVGNVALDNMLATADITEDKELGFYTCWVDGFEVPGEFCTGDQCTVQLHDCRGKPRMGGFHTHPGADHPKAIRDCAQSSFSDQDILHDLWNGLRHACVSGPDTDYITCWQPYDDANYEKAKRDLSHLPVVLRDLVQKVLELLHDDPAPFVYQAYPSPACDDPGVDQGGRWERDGLDLIFYPQRARNFVRGAAEEELGVFVSLKKAEVLDYLRQAEAAGVPEPEPELAIAENLLAIECEAMYTRRTLQDMARRRGLSTAGNRHELCVRLVKGGAFELFPEPTTSEV